jgi:hypothetical protein
MNVSQPLPLLSGALLNNQEFSLARTVVGVEKVGTN